MNEPKIKGKAGRPPRSIDDEIAETEARLQALRNKQQEEKDRRQREGNRVEILRLIQAEGLDAAPVAKWKGVLPGLRELLEIAPESMPQTAEPEPGPEAEADVAEQAQTPA